MTVIITLIAILVSGLGIAYLTRTDAKRIRAHKLAAVRSSRRPLAWATVYLPGLLLLIFDQWTPAMMWLGAMPFVGWAIAVTPPETYVQAQEKLSGYKGGMAVWGSKAKVHWPALLRWKESLASVENAALKAQIDALEARVAELESKLTMPDVTVPDSSLSSAAETVMDRTITPLPGMVKAG